MSVGFLKFLKREKKERNLDELDLPPAPPPLGSSQAEADFGAYAGFDENLPELPDFPDFEKERISAPEEHLPKLDFPEMEEKTQNIDKSQDIYKWKNTQDFPAFSEIEEKPMPPIAPISMPSITPEPLIQTLQPAAPKQEPIAQSRQMDFPQQEPYQKMKFRHLGQEKRVLRQSLSAGPVYVRIDKFKGTLGSINTIRSDLRRSEEALTKLENIKNVKDKSFDKLKSSMDDLQKKLIFIDKTLFKGE